MILVLDEEAVLTIAVVMGFLVGGLGAGVLLTVVSVVDAVRAMLQDLTGGADDEQDTE